jgi:hypothetical protein
MVPDLTQAQGSVNELDPILEPVQDMTGALKLEVVLALAPAQVLELTLPLKLVMSAAMT